MSSFIITAIDGTTFDLYDASVPCTIEEGKQSISLQGEDTLTLKVKSARPLPLAIGDSCSIFGRRYALNVVPPVRKVAPRKFVYELVFEGLQYSLMDVQFLLPEGSVSDSLTADMSVFLSVLMDNITRVKEEWELGDYPTGTEYKTMVFEGENCLSVLQRLCEEFEQEFEIEQQASGKTILHIRPSGETLPLTFRFGSEGGLYELTRRNVDSKNIVTRLYVYGGSNNLIKYRHNRLCLPDKIKNQSYIEDADAVGMYGVKENVHVFDNVFPNRYGKVTSISDDYLTFSDSSMNFDLNEKESDGVATKWLIAGVSAKVHFNTGGLAGYEFEIQKDGGYNHAEKSIKLIPFTDENGMEFPSQTNAAFRISVDDQYFFKDIRLPDQYVTDAEEELSEKGAEYYGQNSQPQVEYGLNIHEEFIRRFSGSGNIVNLFAVGDSVRVVDADVAVDKHIRIAAFERDVLKPYKYSITLSDTVTRDAFTRVISDVLNIDRIVAINHLADPSRARRAWRASQEVLSMVFDPEGDYYSDKIKPLSIETTMLQVGAKSMQFALRNVIFEPNYEGYVNIMRVTAGQLIHYAIEDAIRTWNLGALTFSDMESDTAYYIYARCQKGSSEGSFLLDTAQRKVDDEAGYYTFLIGVLNSVETDDDGGRAARYLSLTYGSSTVNGRFIRTGRIESSGGGTGYFDVDTMTFNGKVTFGSGSSGYDNLSDKPDLSVYDEAVDYVDNVLPGTLEGIQSQVDGKIESWFQTGDPSTAWNTADLKSQHTGDIWYNTSTKMLYRYTGSGWSRVEDADAINAAAAAADAQDTADGKRRVFVSTPSPPYDVGDLWAQGATGDLMRCKTARQSGSYVATDWEKASKYTDDTAANSAYSRAGDALSDAEAASNAANAAASAANDKAKVFYGTSGSVSDAGVVTPPTGVTGMRTNDLYVNGQHIFRYSGSSWVVADKFTVQETIVNGGLVTTGAITFGNTGGMSASGTVRIWSGGSVSSPTFRVESDGSVYSNGTIKAMNDIILYDSTAGLSGAGSGAGAVRMWAGGSKSQAPFRVMGDGSIYIAGFKFSGSLMENDGSYSSFSSGKFFLRSNDEGSLGFRYSSYKFVAIGLMTMAGSTGINSTTSPQIRSENTLSTLYDGETKYNVLLETRGSTERNIHIRIPRSGGWDEGEISIEARRFSNESSGLKRNCIRMTSMPNRTQINTLGTVSRRALYWDETSGYIFWE